MCQQNREEIMKRMTEDQKKTLPTLLSSKSFHYSLSMLLRTDMCQKEEFRIIEALRSAKHLKDQLEELMNELRLEAENDIDLRGHDAKRNLPQCGSCPRCTGRNGFR